MPALSGLWNHYLTRAEFAQAGRVVDQMFEIAQDAPTAVVTMLAHHFRGVGLLFAGQADAAVPHFDRGAALYELGRHRQLALEYGEDPGVVGHQCASLTHWVLGRSERALQHLEQGHRLARTLAHPFSQAQMLWMDAVIALDGRDLDRLDRSTQQLVALCVEHDFPLWLAGGRILRGAALVLRGRLDEGLLEADNGLQAWRDSGTLLMLPHALSVVAGVHALHGATADAQRMLDEALECARRTGEHWFEAELHRQQGELWLGQGGAGEHFRSQARASFERALELAHRQHAICFEQRAAASLARMDPPG